MATDEGTAPKGGKGRLLPWFRIFTSDRGSAKLRALSDQQFRVWFGLQCLAAEQTEERGTIRGYDRDVLALEVADGDQKLLDEALERLAKLQLVVVDHDIDGELIEIAGFLERQYDKPSERPEATRERQRQRREKQAAEAAAKNAAEATADVTPRHANVTPLSRPSHATEREIDKTEKEKEGERGKEIGAQENDWAPDDTLPLADLSNDNETNADDADVSFDAPSTENPAIANGSLGADDLSALSDDYRALPAEARNAAAATVHGSLQAPRSPPPQLPVPTAFALTAERLAIAAKYGVRDRKAAVLERDKFLAHYRSNGEERANWDAAWESWCGRVDQYRPSRPPSRKKGEYVE